MRACLVAAGLLLLAGCDQNTASRQEKPPRKTRVLTDADVVPPPAVPADTARPYVALPGFADAVQASPLVRILNEDYRIQLSARLDSARPLRYVPPPQPGTDPADSTQNSASTGFEGFYTFRLLRADDKVQFVRQLKKTSFSDAVSPDLAVEADVTMPVFSGYLPAFRALAFEINFYPPESDAGGQALLLLDAATGRVRHQSMARWTGGCNSGSVLSADGRTLLTSCEMLQANGHVTTLEKPGRQVQGTLLVNDETALVVYGPGYDRRGREVPLKGPNAQLLATNGRVLKSFTLMSIDGGLGSHMLSAYVRQTRTHYLYDETNNQLGIVPRDHPTQVQVLKLRQLPAFRAPRRPTEVRFAFDTEMGTKATFYVDVATGRIRHRVHKPAF